jgi:hypothetical protein
MSVTRKLISWACCRACSRVVIVGAPRRLDARILPVPAFVIPWSNAQQWRLGLIRA